MQIGIYTRYQRRDPTYMAIQLAELISRRGGEVSVLSDTPNFIPVDPHWDRRTLRYRQTQFTQWARELDLLVWTHIPPTAQARWCRKHDIATVLLFPWDEFWHHDPQQMRAITRVVSPLRACGALLRDSYDMRNVTVIPWAASLPPLRRFPASRESPPRLPKVLFPLVSCQPLRMETSIVNMACCVARSGLASVEVMYDVVAGYCRRQLMRLHKSELPITVTRVRDELQQRIKYAEADLVVWGSLIETCGLTGLRSLTMGTPVVSFKRAPAEEFVVNGRNGFLVDAPFQQSELGVPYIDTDYVNLTSGVLDLLRTPGLLLRLQQEANYNMTNRQTFFDDQWLQLLGLAIPNQVTG